jgi:CRP-like cAMP-binding protein/membrane protein YdbS with pleckstrin-like domain
VKPTEAELEDFWSLFKDKPLFAKWADAEAQVKPQVEKLNFKPNQAVFRPGSLAESVYFVGQGTIVQVFREGDTPWLRRELKRGDYFGHQSLFSDKYSAETVAATDAVVYTLPAQTLRLAMEQNPDLYEDLLHEKSAERLRAIPLFRSFPEDDLLRLSALLEQVDLAAGAALPLDEKQGLWIIDYGHVRVAGPASFGRSGFRLTAGNFFLTEGVRQRTATVATEATATLPTRLFYLPAEHVDRLAQTFPDVGQLIARPVDIASALAGVPLFNSEGMTDAHRQHLAQFVGWSFVPERQNVTSQGSVGHSFVILRDGAAVVSSLDEEGRLRPRTYLSRDHYYGATSLLEGKTRDVTVRAVVAPSHDNLPGVRGADVLTLDRRDLEYAFADRRDLWKRGIGLYDNYQKTKEEKRKYIWQTEGEVIVWNGRPHIWWLIQPLLILTAFAVLAWLLVQVAPSALQSAAHTIWILWLGVLGLIAVFAVVNYYDDYYIVTNKRVARRDRQLWLLTQTMMEAPLETIQDVTLNTDFWGRLMGFGDLTVRTAAKVGAIVFRHLPRPEYVRQETIRERAQVIAITRGSQRETLRDVLITTLRVTLPIPDRGPALGNDVRPPGRSDRRTGQQQKTSKPQTTLPPSQSAWARFWRRAAEPLPEQWRSVLFASPALTSETVEGVTWRKHWIVLVWKAWIPFLILLGLLIALPLLDSVRQALGMESAAVTLPWLIAFLVTFGWLWWVFVDYRNDLYVVTDEKIIDIERKPLGLDYKRREGNLERIQSVDSKQVGVFQALFNYGTVVIRTAAADEGYDFINVPNPKHVQQVVFQKLDAFRQRKAAKDAVDRQQSVVETLQVYDDLRQSDSQIKVRSW